MYFNLLIFRYYMGRWKD